MRKYNFFEKCGTYHETLQLEWDPVDSISMTIHSSCMGEETIELKLSGQAVTISDGYWLLAFTNVVMNGEEVFDSSELSLGDVMNNKALVLDFIKTPKTLKTDWDNKWFWLSCYVANGINTNTTFDAVLSFNTNVLQPKGEFVSVVQKSTTFVKVMKTTD